MPIKTFRGKLEHAEIQTIPLHTNNGSIGYKIVKFQVMAQDANENLENTVKIYSIPQTTASIAVDFSDQTLLAAAMIWSNQSQVYVHENSVVFDNMIFNQDIFVTNFDTAAAGPINYYIELEQMTLDLNDNTVATLKDIRNITG